MYPSAEKLFNLLNRAYLQVLEKDTMDLLKYISKSSYACQAYSSKPITF